MSVKCTSYVWEYSETKGSDRLVLLALADACNDDGEWSPGVSRLATKANLSERQTQRCLRNLEEINEIRIEKNKGIKTSSGYTNHYVMQRFKEWAEGVTPMSPLRDQREGQGVTRMSPLKDQGVTRMSPQGVTRMSPNSSVEPSVKDLSGSAVSASAECPLDNLEQSFGSGAVAVTTPPPTPSPQKSTAKGSKGKPAAHPQTSAIIKAYFDGMNRHEPGRKFTANERKQVLGPAKLLAEAGWTANQVTECIDTMKADRFWASQAMTLNHVRKHIATKVQYTGSQTNGSGPTIEQYLLNTYSMDNLAVVAISEGRTEDDIRNEYERSKAEATC